MHLNVLYLTTLDSSSSDISFVSKLKKNSKKMKENQFFNFVTPSYKKKDKSNLGWITKVVENCSKNFLGRWNTYESSFTQKYLILILKKKAKMTWKKLCDPPLLREKSRIKLNLNNESCRELSKELRRTSEHPPFWVFIEISFNKKMT